MTDKRYYVTERQMRILRTQYELMAEVPYFVVVAPELGLKILKDIEGQEIAPEMAKWHMYDKWEGEE